MLISHFTANHIRLHVAISDIVFYIVLHLISNLMVYQIRTS